MSRTEQFDAIRPFAPGKKIPPALIPSIDALADALGLGPAEGQESTGIPMDPKGVVQTDIPADYWPMLSKIESADRPYVQAASSSASGLYQFVRATWIGEGGKWGPTLRPAFGGLKPSPEEQIARAKTFTAKNAAVLKARGIPINRASLYAAHFFGPAMAAKVIGADVNDRADLIAGPEATKANPSILKDKTVGQFLTWLKGKTGEWAR